MEKFWFFNSAPGDPRTYQAQDFANYFGLVLTSGILAVNNQMGLQVEADGTDMRIYVEPGKAIIKGNAYENTANEYLTVDLPEATENRIDRIVLRHDLTNANRHIKLFVKRGTASAPPDLQRDNFVYEISLAQVLLEANTSTIEPLNITDERMDENLAGIVHSMITVPTSQFQEQWDEWFDTNVPAYEQEWRNFMDTLTGQSPVMSVNGITPDGNGNVKAEDDRVGDLDDLRTDEKSNLVQAINNTLEKVPSDEEKIKWNGAYETIGDHTANGSIHLGSSEKTAVTELQNVAVSGWTTATLLNGWNTQFDRTVRFRRVGNMVHISGGVGGGTTGDGTSVFFLPPEMRPARTTAVPVIAGGASSILNGNSLINRMVIHSTGSVTLSYNFTPQGWMIDVIIPI